MPEHFVVPENPVPKTNAFRKCARWANFNRGTRFRLWETLSIIAEFTDTHTHTYDARTKKMYAVVARGFLRECIAKTMASTNYQFTVRALWFVVGCLRFFSRLFVECRKKKQPSQPFISCVCVFGCWSSSFRVTFSQWKSEDTHQVLFGCVVFPSKFDDLIVVVGRCENVCRIWSFTDTKCKRRPMPHRRWHKQIKCIILYVAAFGLAPLFWACDFRCCGETTTGDQVRVSSSRLASSTCTQSHMHLRVNVCVRVCLPNYVPTICGNLNVGGGLPEEPKW